MYVVGATGRGQAWEAVAIEDGRFAGHTAFDSFTSLVATCPDAAVVAVDLPLTFVPWGLRECDTMARALGGHGCAELFLVPPLGALAETELARADDHCRAATGSPLAPVLFELRAKIHEMLSVTRARASSAPAPSSGAGRASQLPPSSLPGGAAGAGAPRSVRGPRPERFVQRGRAQAVEGGRENLRRFARIIQPARGEPEAAVASAGPVFIEARPALVFAALASASAPSFGAQAASAPSFGVQAASTDDRLAALARAGVDIPPQVHEPRRALLDELLAAAALAWTANRHALGQAHCLPPRDRCQHDGELPVVLWV